MNKLHLTTDSSEIISFQYPMGEWQVRLSQQLVASIRKSDEIYINAEVQSADDWVKLLLLVDAVKALGYPRVKLGLPYYPYARADRRFVEGDCCGAEVFTKSLSYSTEMYTVDAHNPTILKTYGVKDQSPTRFITKAVIDIAIREKTRRIGLVFPDQGAATRYAGLPHIFGNNHHEIQTVRYIGEKQRDPLTGVVTGLALVNPSEDVVLVVDDICDGGKTFSEVASLLSRPTKYLYVTHGIFSKGPSPLAAYKRIYTTDSVNRDKWKDLYTTEFYSKLTEFNTSEVLWG